VSKQQQATKQQSIAEAIAEAERVLEALKVERKRLAAKAADLSEATARLSYGTHALHDAASTKELNEVRADTQHVAQAMREHDHAIVEAEQRLAQARQVQAREERRAAIMEDQKLSKEFRKLGPFLDRATDDLRRGMLALKQNAASVGKDHRHVAMLHRVLQVAFFGTPLQEYVGVPDSNDRRTFSTFSSVIGSWCDSNDASLKHELEALDGEQTEKAA
jgi:hypothetical protein